ncbi:MAG: beta-ketoacyl synthase chain length factor [Chitinophagaceae bacterium]
MYITAASTISHQPTFRNNGFALKLSELKPASEIIEPDYSEFIPAMDRRRMSGVIKMAIACSIDCLKQAGLSQPDGIIVGTSMGCSVHTKNFLDKILAANEGLLSPTSFIVSTHNTIAGQISLLLKNHGYNMTHTQNSLSFEQALLDGILCIQNEYTNVLVGGADEEENSINNIKGRLNDENIHITCGASFFILSDKADSPASLNLAAVESFGLIDDAAKITMNFLDSNNISPEEIDLVLYSNSGNRKTDELKRMFGQKKIFDYQTVSGTYYTNSAFAVHYGADILLEKAHPVFGDKISRVLVYNNLIPENLGLILLDNKIN